MPCKKGDVSHLWIGLSLMSSVRAARSGRHPVVAPRLQPASPEGIPGRKLHVRYWMVRGCSLLFILCSSRIHPHRDPRGSTSTTRRRYSARFSPGKMLTLHKDGQNMTIMTECYHMPVLQTSCMDFTCSIFHSSPRFRGWYMFHQHLVSTWPIPSRISHL